MSFSLSASLNCEEILAHFKEFGYVSIPDILPAEHADRVHRTLRDETHWSLVFNDRERHIDMPAEQLKLMSASKIRDLQQAIYNQARDHFQFCYNNYPVYDAYRQGLNNDHGLHRFYEFLRGEEFLQFTRLATGYTDISFLDAQATRFNPGHFLNTHDDVQKGKQRRCAYILNFTPEWSPDWGGYLQLLDENGNVRRGLRPSFNTLNIIAIPQPHCVSIVAPFAPRSRLCITGWLRYGEEQ